MALTAGAVAAGAGAAEAAPGWAGWGDASTLAGAPPSDRCRSQAGMPNATMITDDGTNRMTDKTAQILLMQPKNMWRTKVISGPFPR
jgi:hypothetical protein